MSRIPKPKLPSKNSFEASSNIQTEEDFPDNAQDDLGNYIDHLFMAESPEVTVVYGNNRNNYIEGNRYNNTLSGGAGVNTLAGEAGDDVYIVASLADTIIDTEGFDAVWSWVSFNLSSTKLDGIEDLALLGNQNLAGVGNVWDNWMSGNDGSNSLSGLTGNDTLLGQDGRDTLVGGAGNDSMDGGRSLDSMVGGLGNDTYQVDVSSDVISELPNEGVDFVTSSISYVLTSPNVENLTLIGTANIKGTGNKSANTIRGNAGSNVLSGGGGRDSLFGDAGNDTLNAVDVDNYLDGGDGDDYYVILAAGSKIREASADKTKGGFDTVQVSSNYTLLANIEGVVLTGSAKNASGNQLNNRLSGNSLSNSLNGGLGADTLIGGGGDDTLDGGIEPTEFDGSPSIDSLVGGEGNDIYIVKNIGDQVIEVDSQHGKDTVISYAPSSTGYRLGSWVENLQLAGAADLTGKGNEMDNLLVGNDGNNVLYGHYIDGAALGGNDTLVGGLGNDSLYCETGNSSMVGGAGFDLIITGSGKDTIDGGLNADNLFGGRNADSLIGGGGNDTLRGEDDKDTLSGGLDNDSVLGGSGNDSLCGDDGNDTIKGGFDIDILRGGGGNDWLDGEEGRDTIYGGAGDDTIASDYGSGSDLIFGEAGDDLIEVYNGMVANGGDGDDKLLRGTGANGQYTLTGGTGSDVFDLEWGSLAVITDFKAGEDRLTGTAASLKSVSLEGTSYQHFVGYEGISYNGYSIIAVISGIGSAQAAIDSMS